MSLKASEIFGCIEKIAPRNLAESWDNVGLQIGSYNQQVSKVLLTLDVTEEVVEEAAAQGAELIISHHPFIFNGLKHICLDEKKGRMVARLIEEGITLYSAHTNIDIAQFGLNDYIAEILGIKSTRPLDPANADKYYKLVVYVPFDKTDSILEVLGAGGAGFVGNYSHCTFRTTGKGTFKPLADTHPYIGTQGKVETVIEDRVETIIDARMVKTMITKLKNVHPYEEMAYDLYPLDADAMFEKDGLGKIGMLDQAMAPDAFLEYVKNKLQVKVLRTAGTPPERVSRVALCTGSGADFIGLAKLKKADAYVTGDMKYHDAQHALENGLWVIDAGHFGTEKMVVDLLAHTIEKAFPRGQIQCLKSRENRDFFTYY